VPDPVLQLHGEAGTGAEPRDGRRTEGGHDASGTSFAKARFKALMMPFECNSAVWRSSQGFSCTKKKPMFDEYAPVSKLNPLMVL